jgi:hypothetical protein
MPPDVSQTLVHTPEYALVLAILHQAYVDLRDTAPAQERANSLAFFGNERRHLEWLCDLASLDHTGIQDAVRRQYPGVREQPNNYQKPSITVPLFPRTLI